MFPIASSGVIGTDSTVWFYSVPATFTHLQLRATVVAPSSAATNQYSAILSLGVSGSLVGPNYAHTLYGDGTSAASSYSAGSGFMGLGYGLNGGTSIRSSFIIDILDYANTNKYKTVRSLWGNDANGSGRVGLNSNSTPTLGVIDTIALNFGGTNLGIGSRIDLYGIQTSNATGA